MSQVKHDANILGCFPTFHGGEGVIKEGGGPFSLSQFHVFESKLDADVYIVFREHVNRRATQKEVHLPSVIDSKCCSQIRLVISRSCTFSSA